MKNKISIVGATSFVALLWACSSIPGVCDDPGSCQDDGGAPEGSSSGSEAGIDAPPGCDLTREAKDSPACVDDAVGVFVDGTTGLDTNAGTKLSPVKSIGAALGKLGNKPRVYVCAGTYEMAIVTRGMLEASKREVRLVFGPARLVPGAHSSGSVPEHDAATALTATRDSTLATAAPMRITALPASRSSRRRCRRSRRACRPPP